jgi:hypothetical protein
LLEPYIYPTVQNNNHTVSFEAFLAFAHFWDANVADSDLQHVQHAKEILLLQELVTGKFNKRLLLCDWHAYNSMKDDRMGSFKQLIEPGNYIKKGVYTALEYVASSEQSLYFVDAHGHINEAGHQAVAEKFFFPDVLKLLEHV